jgi:hypothetical protein
MDNLMKVLWLLRDKEKREVLKNVAEVEGRPDIPCPERNTHRFLMWPISSKFSCILPGQEFSSTAGSVRSSLPEHLLPLPVDM